MRSGSCRPSLRSRCRIDSGRRMYLAEPTEPGFSAGTGAAVAGRERCGRGPGDRRARDEAVDGRDPGRDVEERCAVGGRAGPAGLGRAENGRLEWCLAVDGVCARDCAVSSPPSPAEPSSPSFCSFTSAPLTSERASSPVPAASASASDSWPSSSPSPASISSSKAAISLSSRTLRWVWGAAGAARVTAGAAPRLRVGCEPAATGGGPAATARSEGLCCEQMCPKTPARGGERRGRRPAPSAASLRAQRHSAPD